MASSSADFVVIGPRTTLYTPPKPNSGNLIILCTWMGAARKHIDKYIAVYRDVAPGARILLIESSVDSLTSAFVRRQRVVKFAPAAAAVLDTLADCEHCSPLYPKGYASGYLDDEERLGGQGGPIRGSGHCAHLAMDGKRYVEAVQGLWDGP